ncbi:MAG: VOC family protein [Flammeovirgaceae bacterium]
MINKLDHLVYAVPDLEKGMTEIEQLFGLRPQVGGRHLTKGTHNALLRLGQHCYFEIIASDPANQAIQEKRWMGVDAGLTQGRLTRWAVASHQLMQEAPYLKAIHPDLARVEAGSRMKSDGNLLQWQLTTPLATPLVEIAPFLIDWQDSIHPSVGLEVSCKLISLTAKHPEPHAFEELFQKLDIHVPIEEATAPELMATIQTPNGLIVLN